MRKRFWIYKITNIINGKFYIGQTMDLSKRKYAHKNSKDSETYISRSVIKYGWENHKLEQLFYAENIEIKEANQIEIYYIRYFNSCFYKNPLGMNLNEGGMQGIQTKEQINRMSDNKFKTWKKQIGKEDKKIEVYDQDGVLLIKTNEHPREICSFLNIENAKRLVTKFTRHLVVGKGFFYKKYIVQWEGENKFEEYLFRKNQRISLLRKAPLTEKRLNSLVPISNWDNQKKPVIDLHTGLFYDSIREFAKSENISSTSVIKRFKTGKYNRYKILN